MSTAGHTSLLGYTSAAFGSGRPGGTRFARADSPVDVHAAENTDNFVAVNSAGSAGVEVGNDEPEFCLDVATELPTNVK